jgi:uncharacterized radical SAM superfamily Fe-S cluster-containing enzyme
MTAAPRLSLSRTRSVCPVCLEVVEAERTMVGDTVFLGKTCPEHGRFDVPIWRGAASYLDWGRKPAHPVAPVAPATAVDRGCPHDCGLCPDHRQQSCCVLLEVTSRCDLACPVCFASAGRAGTDASLPEISRWLDALMASGGRVHIQLSGGEPSIRDDLPGIVRLIRARGFDFVQLNTNGVRIARDPRYMLALADAGLDCVFLQFDGVSDDVYRKTRGARLMTLKERAIDNAAAVGVGVVLVPTLVPGINDGEIGAIVDFAVARLPAVRAVHFQPVSYFGRCMTEPKPEDRITLPEVMTALARHCRGIRPSDFEPGSAENPYCSFSARFRVDEAGRFHSLGEKPGCCGVSGDVARQRRAVAGQWSRSDCRTCDGEEDAFDRFLKERERTLGLSGMAFQDAWTLDLDRVRQCHIHVVAPDCRVIPFCAYNLTARDGRPLYRTNPP